MKTMLKLWQNIETSASSLLKLPVTLGVVLALAGLSLIVPPASADQTMPGSVSAADQDFMLAAAQGGMTEVKLGELAAQNGVRQDVKDFGAMMVKDHSAIGGDLQALAVQKNVTLPAVLDEKHQGMVDKLAALSGEKFDKAYIAAMVKAHKRDLKAFQAELAATQDPDIKTFLNKSIPTVSAHLQHITDIKSMK